MVEADFFYGFGVSDVIDGVVSQVVFLYIVKCGEGEFEGLEGLVVHGKIGFFYSGDVVFGIDGQY